jgi:predicted nucleic acid-binding protein
VIVLDGAGVVDYLAGREYGPWIEAQLIADGDVHVPHLLDIEVANALRGLVAGDRLSQRDARRALDDFADLELARYPHTPFLERVWQLRTHVTAYDAMYVALAEVLDATLVTTDARLARSHGHRARIVSP